jgi:hypothetical protein
MTAEQQIEAFCQAVEFDSEWDSSASAYAQRQELARRLGRMRQAHSQATLLGANSARPPAYSSSSASTSSLNPQMMQPLEQNASLANSPAAEPLTMLRRSASQVAPMQSAHISNLTPQPEAPRCFHWSIMPNTSWDAPTGNTTTRSQIPLPLIPPSSVAQGSIGSQSARDWRSIGASGRRDIGNAFRIAQQREQAAANRVAAMRQAAAPAKNARQQSINRLERLRREDPLQPPPLSQAAIAQRFFRLGFPSSGAGTFYEA